MTDLEKKRLQKNLTSSARLAKPGAVRALTGRTPEDQGFIAPDNLKVYNTIKGEYTELKELINDIWGQIDISHEKNHSLSGELDKANERIDNLILTLSKQNEEIESLKQSIRDLTLITLD